MGNKIDKPTKQKTTTCNCMMEEHYSTVAALLELANPMSKQAENYLIEQGLVDPQNIHAGMANFILNSCSADAVRKASWNYLQHPDNVLTARAFINLLDLSQPMPEIVKELFARSSPEDPLSLNRAMEILSEEFYRVNPHLVPTADAAYMLAFGSLGLMTELNRPNITYRKELWLSGMILTPPIDVHVLEQIYDYVEANPWEANPWKGL